MPWEQREFDLEGIERRSVLEMWTPDEIFDDADEAVLKRLYEDHRIERKPPGSHADLLAVYVCMWANTPPDGGIIAVGVDDDGTISGCSKRGEALADIEHRLRSDLVPSASFTTRRVYVTDKTGQPNFVVLFRVQFRHSALVETNKCEAWIRFGSSKHRLTDDEKREIRLERGELSFELESCGLDWPERFNEPAATAWVANVAKAKNITAGLPLISTLVNHRLGTMQKGDFVPNNACALLFAKSPQDIVPGCMIRFQRIEGSETETGHERNVVHDIRITGSVPEMIEQTGAVLSTHLRTYSRLGKDNRFYTAPEYPEEAWVEALVNACVHRSYSLKGTNIFIRMFDDRLEFDSPGGFPPLVTPENIYDVHHRRNWWLMDAMWYLDFVRCENEGAKRIRRAMRRASLPDPEFQQKQVGNAVVRVTLRNDQHQRAKWVDTDVSRIIGASLASKLDDLERRIVNFAAEHSQINTTQAMNLMANPRWGTANKRLLRLVELGVMRQVRRYPRDPKGHFELVSAENG